MRSVRKAEVRPPNWPVYSHDAILRAGSSRVVDPTDWWTAAHWPKGCEVRGPRLWNLSLQSLLHKARDSAINSLKSVFNSGQISSGQEVLKKTHCWSIHTMENYSATKRDESRTHATTCMDLENIMFRERSHTQKDTCCMIWNIQKRQTHRDRR